MRNRRDLRKAIALFDNIKNHPTADFDNDLFNMLLDLAELEKEVIVNGRIKDNGKEYILLSCEGEGEWVRVKDFLLSFDERDAAGFVLDGIIIEKDFILEIIASFSHSSVCTVLGDITEFEGDAIVNAANSTLLGGGGVDGAIHSAAGPELLSECITLGGCKSGEAKLTKAYNLPCDYVIHTVGPIYNAMADKAEAERTLISCYMSSLRLLKDKGLHTIAFPSIATGVYGYPIEKASKTAKKAVNDFIKENRDYFVAVYFYCFSRYDFEVYSRE